MKNPLEITHQFNTGDTFTLTGVFIVLGEHRKWKSTYKVIEGDRFKIIDSQPDHTEINMVLNRSQLQLEFYASDQDMKELIRQVT